MASDTPTGAFVWNQIHMENAFTAARAEHCCLLLKPVLFDDVQRLATEVLRKSFFDKFRTVWQNKPSI